MNQLYFRLVLREYDPLPRNYSYALDEETLSGLTDRARIALNEMHQGLVGAEVWLTEWGPDQVWNEVDRVLLWRQGLVIRDE